ncbi:MAG: EMC3/TMCO1 family protein [Candidatus Micrarchaeaceae archaeon]
MSFFAIFLVLGAAAYVAFSILMQRKLSNPKRLREIQGIIKSKSKELNELSKSHADTAVLAQKQKELTPLLSETMKLQFKPMLVVLPTFIILYYAVLPMLFAPGTKLSLFSFTVSYQIYFIFFSFIFGLIASLAVSFYDRKQSKRESAKTSMQSAQQDKFI